MFTLEETECIADCGRAPCLAVNHRFVGDVTPESFDRLVEGAARRELLRRHPPHGTLVRVRRQGGLRVDDATISAEREAAVRARPPGRRARMMVGDRRPPHRDVAARVRGLPHPRALPRHGRVRGLRKALGMTPEEVAREVDAVSLLGRGGAGFPAGRKWSMLRKAPTTYLVVNGDESEPATFKDHLLIERDPHQLIEGVVIAAYAIQASRAFIYVRGEFALGLERVQSALNDAYEHGAVGRDIFGSGFSIDVVVHPGAGAYICGEETALLESLEGKRGFPRIKPPYFPAAIGLYGEPTVVNNVETLSNLPWVMVNGSAAFTALGAGRSTGTAAVRAGRPRAQSGCVRGGDGEDHLPRPRLRPRLRRRHPRRPGAEGHHPRRRVGPVVRARSTSTSLSARTRWVRPGPCSGRGRSW